MAICTRYILSKMIVQNRFVQNFALHHRTKPTALKLSRRDLSINTSHSTEKTPPLRSAAPRSKVALYMDLGKARLTFGTSVMSAVRIMI